jgi:membrane associated rhomboid family serine protease
MIPAAVGFQCPRCVKAHTRRTRQNQGPFGGAVSARPQMTTYVLLGINLVVFGLISLPGVSSLPWLEWFGLSPIQACHWVDHGCQMIPGVAQGAVWQLFTSLFTHQQWLHLGMNMLTLWFLGPPLERIFGRARFLALYLLAGLAGSVVVLWLSGLDTITLGASGSLFGLIAALLIVQHKLGQDIRQILLWLGLNVVMTVVMFRSISWQGHLGGLIGGAVVTVLLVYLPTGRDRPGHRQWLALAGLGLVLAVLATVRGLQLAAMG